MVLIGEATALFAAMGYACSATILSDIAKTTSPFLLNFLRMFVASAFTYLVLMLFNYSIYPNDPIRIFILLMISGISGIGLGDVFYFKTLGCIGARKTILLETMAPPFTGFISWAYYGTTISLGGWFGIILTMFGVYTVFNSDDKQQQNKTSDIVVKLTQELPLLSENNNTQNTTNSVQSSTPSINSFRGVQDMLFSPFQNMSNETIGFLNGIAYTFCWGLSMVLSHDAAQTGTFNPLQSALIRLIAGLVVVGILMGVKKSEKFNWPFQTKYNNQIFFLGILIGPILGIWAQQISILYTRPEISQTIISTTPIFGMVFTYFKGEPFKARYFYGSFLAILGVCFMIWF